MLLFTSFSLFIFVNFVEGIKCLQADSKDELPLPLDLEDGTQSLTVSNTQPNSLPVKSSMLLPRPHCRCYLNQFLYPSQKRLDWMKLFRVKPNSIVQLADKLPEWQKEQKKARRADRAQRRKLSIGELIEKEGILKPLEEKIQNKIADKAKKVKGEEIIAVADKKNKKKNKIEDTLEAESEEESYDDDSFFWDSDEDSDWDDDSGDSDTNYNYNINTILARRNLKNKQKKRSGLYKKKKTG